MLTEPLRVTLLVAKALNDLRIPYFVGGSLATAVHGVARATMDVDMVADVRAEHAQALVDALGQDFYADTARKKPIRSTSPARKITPWRSCNGIGWAARFPTGNGAMS